MSKLRRSVSVRRIISSCSSTVTFLVEYVILITCFGGIKELLHAFQSLIFTFRKYFFTKYKIHPTSHSQGTNQKLRFLAFIPAQVHPTPR